MENEQTGKKCKKLSTTITTCNNIRKENEKQFMKICFKMLIFSKNNDINIIIILEI